MFKILTEWLAFITIFLVAVAAILATFLGLFSMVVALRVLLKLLAL